MPRRITTFVDGVSPQAAGLNATYQANLLGRTLLRKATGTSWANWPGDGSVQRFAVIPNVIRDTTSPFDEYLEKVIDNEVDWRDRLLLVHVHQTDATLGPGWQGPIVPGLPTDIFFTRPTTPEHSFLGYTRTGAALGPPGGNHIVLSTHIALFARSTDGALIVQRAPADPSTDPRSLWLYILATEPTGQRSSPGASPNIVPVDATPIRPYQLNGFQDRAMLGQAREAGSLTDAYPLGPKGSGDRPGIHDARARIPEIWTKRGQKDRQPLVGGRHRFFVVALNDGQEKVLDSETDWRDRLVWGMGRWSSADAIEPGGADDKLHQDAGTDAWNVGRYTGSGESANANSDEGYHLLITGSLFPGISLYARDTDGALIAANDIGAAITMTGMLWATPQLGCRS